MTLTNLGNAPMGASEEDPLVITDSLPAHVVPYGVLSEAGGQGTAGPVSCAIPAASLVRCSFAGAGGEGGVLPPYEAIELEVLVALDEGARDGEAGQVSVSGGDAPSPPPPPSRSTSAPTRFPSASNTSRWWPKKKAGPRPPRRAPIPSS